MKTIRLSGHAREQAMFRGASEDEIKDAIQTAAWKPSERNRLECRLDVAYNALWNGKWYIMKQVRPIFVDEPGEIVVVTVYVYYF